jgi:hypothetical protein
MSPPHPSIPSCAALRGLFRGLEALYGHDSGIDPLDHIQLVNTPPGQGRETLVMRESPNSLEVALALDTATLTRLARVAPEHVLTDETLTDALPVLEGLSHLFYVTEAARRGRPISGLELEIQAEVDKLALCVLDRWRHWRRAPNTRGHYRALIDRLFYRFSLARDLGPALRERYTTANRLALAFAHRLGPMIARGDLTAFRRTLRSFWISTMSQKRRLAVQGNFAR